MSPRRLLLITYYFPPSGGPGVQRMLKFARYLPEFGWQPTVLTVRPEDAAYPNLDPSLAEEVPPSVRVERTRAWDPYALYARLLGKRKAETVGVGFLGEAEVTWKERLARWIRANVFLPDARVGWVPFAYRRGRALLEREPFDALLTTGPPHSTHLAGWMLARQSRLPWVADFRDPWTEIDYAHLLPKTAPAARIDAALERTVLRQASAVTVVTPTWRRQLRQRAEGRYEVIRNGFDPEDFARSTVPRTPAFVLTYVGNMNEARDPHALWQALEAIDVPARMPRLRLRLVGNIDPVVLESLRRCGLASVLDLQPYVPHAEAVRHMQESTLLLLVVDRVAENMMGRIPGKLYEYVASGRPVLGIGPPGGDAAAVLAASGAGRMFDYGEREAIRAFLLAHYAAWAAGAPKAGAPTEAAAEYSRRTQAGTLARLLGSLVGEREGGRGDREEGRGEKGKEKQSGQHP